MIVAPEFDMGLGHALATRITERLRTLGVGLAMFPDTANSAEALLDASLRAARDATPQSRVKAALPSQPSAHRDKTEDEAPIVFSRAMSKVLEYVDRIARTTISVLLFGETGTGKEVVARAIHDHSLRRSAALMYLNCAAIPDALIESSLFGHERGAFSGAVQRQKGAFEAAHGGTLVLDEIGDLPLPAQAVLLRVLETRRVRRVGAVEEIDADVRFIASTHRNLEAMCDAGEFRFDLYHRLNGITVTIPPLRHRREDIEPLAVHFLTRACRAWGLVVPRIAPDAMALLSRYDWPGNIRELRNVIECAAVMMRSAVVATHDLPDRFHHAVTNAPPRTDTAVAATSWPGSSRHDLKTQIQEHEKHIIVAALRDCYGNTSNAARQLGLPVRTLRHKLRMHRIRNPPQS